MLAQIKTSLFGSKIRVVVSVLLILLTVGVVILFLSLTSNKSQQNLSQNAAFQPEVFGEGNVLVTFEVKIPD